jgi:hypothetical protein
MANSNLFAQYLQAPKSIVDYQNDYAKADALKNQNAMQSLTLQQAASVQQQRNALRDLVQSGQIDLNDPSGLQKAVTVAPDVAPALAKTIQDQKTSAALASKDSAQADNFKATTGKTSQETQIAAHQQHLQALSTVNTPEDAVAWMVQGVKDGTLPAQGLQGALQSLQTQGLDNWKKQTQQSGMTVLEQQTQIAPKPTEVRLGNIVKTMDMNPNSKTFGQEIVPQQAIGVSPDAQLSAQTSRANNAATIAKDYKVAGLDAQGNMAPLTGAAPGAAGSGSPLQGLVDSLGQYKVPETTALQRVPAAQKAQILAAVAQQYPDYDPSNFAVRQKAAKDFATGKQGDAMRSFAVASNHLDQLETLADAVNNGNIPLVNKIGNLYGVQTGAAPAAVFDAVKNIVGQEVVKSIVAGGGGQHEREEAGNAFNVNSSPDQFKGTKAAVKHIMQAQQDALLAQRRGAGLSDKTLPDYGGASNGGGTAPAGWSYLGTVPGGK